MFTCCTFHVTDKPTLRVLARFKIVVDKKKHHCSSCSDEITDGAYVLPCLHVFHAKCDIVNWVYECRCNDRPPTCPVCREDIFQQKPRSGWTTSNRIIPYDSLEYASVLLRRK